jgi:hypothetical protein
LIKFTLALFAKIILSENTLAYRPKAKTTAVKGFIEDGAIIKIEEKEDDYKKLFLHQSRTNDHWRHDYQ